MKTLYASEIQKLIVQKKLIDPVDLLSVVGPETDLGLLLHVLDEYRMDESYEDEMQIEAMMEAIFRLMCLHYPEKAKEYLSNVSSIESLVELCPNLENILKSIHTNKKIDYYNNSLPAIKRDDIVYEVLKQFHIPKLTEFLKKRKPAMIISSNETLFQLIHPNTKTVKCLKYTGRSPHSPNIPINGRKRNKKEAIYNALKSWFDELRNIKTIICDKSEENVIINLVLKIKPKLILPISPKDKESLLNSISILSVLLKVQYKDNKCVLVSPNFDNEDDIYIHKYESKFNEPYMTKSEFIKLYAKALHNFFDTLIKEHKQELSANVDKVIFMPRNIKLFDIVKE